MYDKKEYILEYTENHIKYHLNGTIWVWTGLQTKFI